MGHERVTVLNLRVEKVDPERNLLVVRGAAGPNGGLIYPFGGQDPVTRKRRGWGSGLPEAPGDAADDMQE